ncbi:TniQ family protein [Sinomonas mesophila]|uniref:TniQ family protein n=1 Tax=Sinomonas mesophila TaxID=1531955 RepID=UPI000985D7DF
MTRRWPLHPTPSEGEALSSWLWRLAGAYGMTPDAILRHSLVPRRAEAPRDPMAGIDSAPPEQLLGTLAERTGVPLDRIRPMALAGLEPWIIEPVETEPGMAFENYVHQHSVLLGPRDRPRRLLSGWRPWLPADPRRTPMRRACPSCISTTPLALRSFTLVSQIPLTLTCPDHGCRLEPAYGAPGICFFWESPETARAPAPAAVVAMDRLTHAALSTGAVALPRRTVHAGVWFRLLRTLIDEISIPLSKLPARSRRAVAASGRRPATPPARESSAHGGRTRRCPGPASRPRSKPQQWHCTSLGTAGSPPRAVWVVC